MKNFELSPSECEDLRKESWATKNKLDELGIFKFLNAKKRWKGINDRVSFLKPYRLINRLLF